LEHYCHLVLVDYLLRNDLEKIGSVNGYSFRMKSAYVMVNSEDIQVEYFIILDFKAYLATEDEAVVVH
jgi:hypothetical protein